MLNFYLGHIERNKKLLFLVPTLFGIWSLLLGQDRNFDFANYHLYNGFAFLNNKVGIDLAPAGVQSYLNPLLDSFYYFLNSRSEIHFFKFLIGFIHGLNFILVFKIINFISVREIKINFFLALTGILSCNFLGGLGNSMGDNITSLFVLSSLLIMFKHWEVIFKNRNSKLIPIVFTGIIIGLASVLKLTNALYVFGFLFPLIFIPKEVGQKLKILVIFICGVLISHLLVGGFWYYKVYSLYHNPIFPYFSNIFSDSVSGFTNPTASWGPRNLFEIIFWPFIFTVNYSRVGEGDFHQISWPLVYMLFINFISILVIASFFKSRKFKININDKELFLIIFFIGSYVAWIALFNVMRYLVALELIMPFLIYILYKSIYTKKLTEKNIIRICYFSIMLTILGGYSTWGHSKLEPNPFVVEIPEYIKKDTKASVIITGGSPITWMATQFPLNISFSRFDAFNNDFVRNEIIKRDLPIYVMFGSFYNWREDNIIKWATILDFFGLMATNNSCNSLQNFISKVNFRGKIKSLPGSSIKKCELVLKDSDYIDPFFANKKFIENSKDELSSHKFNLIEDTCEIYSAKLGSQNWKYIMCKVI